VCAFVFKRIPPKKEHRQKKEGMVFYFPVKKIEKQSNTKEGHSWPCIFTSSHLPNRTFEIFENEGFGRDFLPQDINFVEQEYNGYTIKELEIY